MSEFKKKLLATSSASEQCELDSGIGSSQDIGNINPEIAPTHSSQTSDAGTPAEMSASDPTNSKSLELPDDDLVKDDSSDEALTQDVRFFYDVIL